MEKKEKDAHFFGEKNTGKMEKIGDTTISLSLFFSFFSLLLRVYEGRATMFCPSPGYDVSNPYKSVVAIPL
jgi:hypothetical protein